MVAASAGQFRLGEGLPGRAADAGDSHDRLRSAAVGSVHLLGDQREDRPKQVVLRVSNCELRGVNADRQPAGPGVEVVPNQRSLPPLVEPPVGRQRQRARGDH